MTKTDSGSTVVVVDDDEATLRVVLAALREGCGVREARGFQERRAFLSYLDESRGCPPAMVLLDLHSAASPGIEVLHTMRAKGGEAPVAFLASRLDREERQACLDAGALAIVEKSAPYEDLLGSLRVLLKTTSILSGASRCL